MKYKLAGISKILLILAAAGLVFVLFTPIWRIDLDAPQYPEGLRLTIHANGLRGNVDIINGLNHYIGMKTLHNEDFIEFTILPYIIGFFALAFLAVAILNRRNWLYILFFSFVLFGIIAIVDFWRWEYNYGHNLDPNAAIIVPGMAYQPPLIGFKQLLNFGAYSVPDIGGWIFIGCGVLLLACIIIEWRRARLAKKKLAAIQIPALIILLLLFQGCSSGPEKIVPGRDVCYTCKMGISDTKYGGEIITKKGKVYKFDDLQCLQGFRQTAMAKEIAYTSYVADYTGDHSLVKADEAFFLKGEGIRGPMNGQIIAFKSEDSLKKVALLLNATRLSWQELSK